MTSSLTPCLPGWVDRFSRALQDIVNNRSTQRVLLTPSQTAAYGDVSTDIAIELAAELKRSPNSIAEELLMELPVGFKNCSRSQNGFINVTIPDEELFVLEPARASSTDLPESILLPAYSPDSSYTCYSLVAAAAAAQYRCATLMGASPELKVADHCVRLEAEKEGVGAIYRHLIDSTFHGSHQIDYALSDSHRTVFWTHAGLVTGRGHQALIEARESKIFTLKYPDAKGRFPPEESLTPGMITEWSDTECASLVASLLCAAQGRQFDLLAGRLEERLNLVWFCKSLRERILRHSTRQENRPGVSWGIGDGQRRALLVRTRLLGLAVVHAACAGSSGELFSLFAEVADLVSAFFNDPALRIRLEEGSIDGSDVEGIRSSLLGLDCILRVIGR